MFHMKCNKYNKHGKYQLPFMFIVNNLAMPYGDVDLGQRWLR